MNVIRLGTRDSILALWQANYVKDKLEQVEGVKVVIHAIKTIGDKILDVALHKVGSKGLFTEELDELLMKGEIDIAVHSAKDLQTTLPEELPLLAFTEREYPEDVLVSFKNLTLKEMDEKGLRLGTSSVRRRAIVRYSHKNIELVEARGNIQTRFRKMEEGQYDAMILAYAGIKRLNLEQHIQQKFSIHEFYPLAGQGVIAIQGRKGLSDIEKEFFYTQLNHPETEVFVRAEREYLKLMEGGCSMPIYGHCYFAEDEAPHFPEEKGKLYFQAGVYSFDGSKHQHVTVVGGKKNAMEVAAKAAEDLSKTSALEIVKELKEKRNA